MNKKIIIIGLMIITNVINSMDFSTLGKKEGCNSEQREFLVYSMQIEDCRANSEKVKAEFFLQAKVNNAPIIKYFLDLGFQSDTFDVNGDTPLIIALQHNARDVVKLLLDNDADPLQLVQSMPGKYEPLNKYVELYHSHFTELLDCYIRQKYGPSAPAAEDDNLFTHENAIQSESAHAPIERPSLQANTGYISKFKSFMTSKKVLSGMALAIVAGITYKYVCKKENKENKQTSVREL